MCLKCVASVNKEFHTVFKACSTPFEEWRVNIMEKEKYRVSEFHPIPVSPFPLEMSTPQILVYT